MYKKNFVKVNRSMADKIKEIAKDTGVTVSIKWVSIYNRTVIYDSRELRQFSLRFRLQVVLAEIKENVSHIHDQATRRVSRLQHAV